VPFDRVEDPRRQLRTEVARRSRHLYVQEATLSIVIMLRHYDRIWTAVVSQQPQSRERWLVIDPKPFVGDRAYDATQHLFNGQTRMLVAPDAAIRRFADLLEIDNERIRPWMFARAAAEPRDTWNDDSLALARALG
jgi:streptomycin 6-kinase